MFAERIYYTDQYEFATTLMVLYDSESTILPVPEGNGWFYLESNAYAAAVVITWARLKD